VTSDPIQREMLTQLRTLWTALANESPFRSRATLAEQIDAVSRFHADLMQVCNRRGFI
jgi:hypothetical protein